MSPFDHSTYRAYLNAVCDQAGARGLRTQLSAAAGCQPSYLSQALRGRVHLTEDHLAGIASFLRLRADETEFLLLLLREERAGTPALRRVLADQKARLQAKRKVLKHRVGDAGPAPLSEADTGAYFTSWVPTAVHLLTSDPAFGTAEAIAERLELPLPRVTETIRFLERVGLVVQGKQGWRYAQGSFHLPRNSPWRPALHASRRELAARSVSSGAKDAVHFTSLFTISRADLRKLEQMAADFVQKAQEKIHASGTEELAGICLDVFAVV
jgi:uncharacterized protein (TIGR02147 family)